MLSFLTPQLFSVLVIAFAVIGLLLAARQIYVDFKRGPRWPDSQISQESNAETDERNQP